MTSTVNRLFNKMYGDMIQFFPHFQMAVLSSYNCVNPRHACQKRIRPQVCCILPVAVKLGTRTLKVLLNMCSKF